MTKLDTIECNDSSIYCDSFSRSDLNYISGLSACGEKEKFIYTTPFPIG